MSFPDPAILPTRHLVPWALESERRCDVLPAPGTRPGFNRRVLAEAADLIRAGGLVVFPTETVYGLGADARNARAVKSIFAAKGRPSDNPLIVHVHSLEAARACTTGMNHLSAALADLYWPGPLTLVLPRSSLIDPATTAGMDTVGVRIPGSVLARAFLEACGCPVAAPSANQSGRPSPTTFDMAWEEMEGRAAAVMEGPDASLGLESAILFAPDDRTLHLLRAGSMDPLGILADLAARGWNKLDLWYQGKPFPQDGRLTAPQVARNEGQPEPMDAGPDGSTGSGLPAAPGTRYRHYSPRCKVVLWRNLEELRFLRSGAPGSLQGIIGPPESGISQVLQDIQSMVDPGGDSVTQPVGVPPDHRDGAPELRNGTPTRSNDPSDLGSQVFFWPAADLGEYARGLYRSFRDADLAGCEVLFAWLPEGEGEWKTALRDRLLRASGLGHQED